MRAAARDLARAIAAALLLAAATLASVPAEAAEFTGRRGVNFEIWQTWTGKGAFLSPGYDRANFPDWMGRLDDARLTVLRAEGFDFVRLNFVLFLFFWVAESEKAALFDRVVAATRRLHGAGFAVIVDMHLLPEMGDRPDGMHDALGTGGRKETLFARYVGLVAEMARRLAPLPAERTALELINEPDQDWFSYVLATDRWPAQLAALHAAARKAAPDLTLVLSGGRGGGIEGLVRSDPKPYAGDGALIWSFHYYTPMAITHAGQPWEVTPARFLTHLPYPASALGAAQGERLLAGARARIAASVKDPAKRDELSTAVGKALTEYATSGAGPAAVSRDFARVADWARWHGVPARRILLGEFGVFQDEADPAARLALLKATREAAEAAGFSWAIYPAGLTQARRSFGIIGDAATLAVEPGVRASLGLPAR